MKVLTGEALLNSQDLLLDVFRDGYGENYLGDTHFINSNLRPARAAVVNDRFDSLNSAALIGKSARITALATRSDRDLYGSRFHGLVKLIQATQPVADDVWIGISHGAHPAVEAAAEQAGMNQTQDEERVIARLERTGRLSSFAIRSANTGFEISLTDSAHGSGHWAAVWGWDED